MDTLRNTATKQLNQDLDTAKRAGLHEVQAEILDQLHERATVEDALRSIMGAPMTASLLRSLPHA